MKPGQKKYTMCTLISCNVSYKGEMTEEILLDIIRRKKIPSKWLWHMDCFFNEVPRKIFLGFMQENGLSVQDLKPTYLALPKVLQESNFLEIEKIFVGEK